MPRPPRTLVAAAVSVVLAAGLLSSAASSDAVEVPEGAYAGPWSIVVHAAGGRGRPRDSAWSDVSDGDLGVRPNGGGVSLEMGRGQTLDLHPPEGEQLEPGRYPLLRRNRQGQESGFFLNDGVESCLDAGGSFDVLEHRADPWRLVVDLDTGCGSGRIEIGRERPEVWPAPRAVSWSPQHRGAPGLVKTVRTVNSSPMPVQIGRPRLESVARGDGAEDFAILETGCGGVLPGGGQCETRLQVTPSEAGPRAADLVVPTGGGTVRTQLDAQGRPGTTSVTVVDREATWSADPTEARFLVDGGSRGVVFRVLPLDDTEISSPADEPGGEGNPDVLGSVSVVAPGDGALTPGQTLRQQTSILRVPETRNPVRCLQETGVRIAELTFDDEGAVASLAATITGDCGPARERGGRQIAINWQAADPVEPREVVRELPTAVRGLAVLPDPHLLLFAFRGDADGTNVLWQVAKGTTEPPGTTAADDPDLNVEREGPFSVSPLPATDYAFTLWQYRDGYEGPATDVVLRGSATTLAARQRRDGRYVARGIVRDTAGDAVAGGEVAVELRQAGRWRQRVRRTDDRGRFRVVVRRLDEARTTFLGAYADGQGVIGSYAVAVPERQR